MQDSKDALDHEDKSIPCNICPKTFFTLMALQNHMRVQHTSSLFNGSNFVRISKTDSVQDVPESTAINSNKTEPNLKNAKSDQEAKVLQLDNFGALENNKNLIKVKMSNTNIKVKPYFAKECSIKGSPEDIKDSPKISPSSSDSPKVIEDNLSNVKIKPILKLTAPLKTNSAILKANQIKTEDSDSSDITSKSPEKRLYKVVEWSDLKSLVSYDVNYVIVKQDENQFDKTNESTRKSRKKELSSPGNSEGENSNRAKKIKLSPKERIQIEPANLDGPFKCVEQSTEPPHGPCDQIFLNCCQFSLHFRDEHTKRRKSNMRCQVCEKLLNDVLCQATQSCQVCGSTFNNQDALEQHCQTAHVKSKPYRCDICQKSFTLQGGVVQHMRIHTGERPYNCEYCNKPFTQKSGLNQHLRTHTKEKPYRCIVCEKSFTQQSGLKYHMRLHTNINPYECNICNKRFKVNKQLLDHLKCHNAGDMGECMKGDIEDESSYVYNVASEEIV